MADVEDIKRLEYLRKQIKSSAGWKIEMATGNLGASYYIFMTNYDHLKNALELFNRDEVSPDIWAIKNDDRLDQFQTEIIRLFHNYLASVKSLIDHTDVMVKNVHENKKFSKEYHIKVQATFGNSSLSHFIKGLRNYIVHKGIPIMIAQKTLMGLMRLILYF